jgi:hypothetical protein
MSLTNDLAPYAIGLTLFLGGQSGCTGETAQPPSNATTGGTSAAQRSSDLGGATVANGGTGIAASSVIPGSGTARGGAGMNTSSTSSGGTLAHSAAQTQVGGAATSSGSNHPSDSGGSATGGSATGGSANLGGTSSSGAASAGTGVVNGRGGTSAATSAGTTAGHRATGGAAQVSDSSAAAGSKHSVKIMPFGDSITGTTCYPQLLAATLKTNGHGSFEFVGTNTNNQSCNSAPFVNTEGHGGYLVTYLLTDTPPQSGKGTLKELKQWVTAKPDLVLMHYGTNDVWNNVSADDILAAYAAVMNEFRVQNPSVTFFVSKIIPMNPSGCSQCGQRVETLNAKLTETWAAHVTTVTSPVYIIDNWTGMSASTDTSDGVHPTPAGAQKMATATAAALAAKGLF